MSEIIENVTGRYSARLLVLNEDVPHEEHCNDVHYRLVAEYNKYEIVFVRDEWLPGTGWHPMAIVSMPKEQLKRALEVVENYNQDAVYQ